MKTFIRSILIFSALVMTCSLFTQAQTEKSFTGTVTYSISYTGNIDAATAAQQPKIATVKIMGNKQKTEIAFGPATIWFQNDGDKKENIILLDMMGEKKYFKMNAAEIEEDYNKNGTPEITYSEETKDVAGYSCKKAEYKSTDSDGKESTVVIYYTQELGGEQLSYGSNFQGLKGFPLEYVIVQGEFSATYAATAVKKGKVKDLDFLIPADFVECTPEEKAQLKAAFGGGEE